MTDNSPEFRPLLLRAKTLGRALLEIYESEADGAPPELLELLDLAEQRLQKAGYKVTGAQTLARPQGTAENDPAHSAVRRGIVDGS